MSLFVFSIFVFQTGLRWQTGTDWEIYLVHFEEALLMFFLPQLVLNKAIAIWYFLLNPYPTIILCF